MKIKILVKDPMQGEIVYVSKTRYIGDLLMYGVKSKKRSGLVWYKSSEVEEVTE